MRRIALFALLLAATGCEDPLEPEWDSLRDAEERWEAAGIDAYSYVLEFNCLCNRRGLVGVEVAGDSIVSAEWFEENEGFEMPAMTVEEMFDEVRAALRREPDEARLDFSETGYPESIHFDFDEDTLDEEWNFQIEEFVVLD